MRPAGDSEFSRKIRQSPAPNQLKETCLLKGHINHPLIQEIKRQHVLLGRLAPEYCDVMSAALARYLCGRYGSRDVRSPGRPMKLPPWRLRWLTEYANDRLDRAISTAEIASEIGISVGHLHRAFRLTTGQTLLTFVNEQRIQRAQQLLVSQNVAIGDIALQVFSVRAILPGSFDVTPA